MSNKQMNKVKKKKGKVFKIILILIAMVVCIYGVFFYYRTQKNGGGMQGMLATIMGHDEETLKNLDEFRILLLGVSSDISSVLTDTIMVASYNPKTQKATLLSIPRDTYVGTNSKNASSYDKINCIYQKGPEAILKKINIITGLNIKYYAAIDTKALRELVDEIGGVEFYVPTNMNYDDPTQDLHIHLNEGQQLLDGDKAEQVLRFRKNNDLTGYSSDYGSDDAGRMRTQREFIITVAKQTLKAKNILKLNELLEIVHRNISTNVALSDAKDYIPYIVNFQTENIQTAVLPGENQKLDASGSPSGYLWFFKHNEKKTKDLIEQLFNEQNDIEEDTTSDQENVVNETNSTGKNVTNNVTNNINTTRNTISNTKKNNTTNTNKKSNVTNNQTKNSTTKKSATNKTTKTTKN